MQKMIFQTKEEVDTVLKRILVRINELDVYKIKFERQMQQELKNLKNQVKQIMDDHPQFNSENMKKLLTKI